MVNKMKIFLIILLISVFAGSIGTVNALTPPVNLWGLITVDGQIPADGTSVDFTADCFDNGVEIVASTETSYATGYYDVNIPYDDPLSNIDEGCVTGQNIEVSVRGKKLGTLILPDSGMSIRVDLASGTAPNDSNQTNETENSETENNGNEEGGGAGGSGGSGGMNGATYTLKQDSELDNIQTDVNKFIPDVVPPVNIYGFVFMDGTALQDGKSVEIIGDCYGSGEEVLSSAAAEYGNGYYDLNIPVDSPYTDEDEGCDIGQVLKIKIDGKLVKQSATITKSGDSYQLDIIVGKAPVKKIEASPTVEEPTSTNGENSKKPDWIYTLILFVIIILTGIGAHLHHKHHVQ